jgi:hypothetical protein
VPPHHRVRPSEKADGTAFGVGEPRPVGGEAQRPGLGLEAWEVLETEGPRRRKTQVPGAVGAFGDRIRAPGIDLHGLPHEGEQVDRAQPLAGGFCGLGLSGKARLGVEAGFG